MMITASVSDFRQNLTSYLEQLHQGTTIIVKDQKRNQELARVTMQPSFDPVKYGRVLQRVAGTFTAKAHPEWATKAKVEQWLRKTRLASDRRFHIPRSK